MRYLLIFIFLGKIVKEYCWQDSKSWSIYETFLGGEKLPSAQTPHLLRNHCPFRKAQTTPGQVSEINKKRNNEKVLHLIIELKSNQGIINMVYVVDKKGVFNSIHTG